MIKSYSNVMFMYIIIDLSYVILYFDCNLLDIKNEKMII